MTTTNRLYRSNTDKVIGGVAGGLGDYLNIDPVIVRILFVLLAIFGGSGLLIYIILWIVIPAQVYTFGQDVSGNESVTAELYPEDEQRKTNTGFVAGLVLIAFGLLFLADQLIPYYHLWDFWPVLLIVAGVLIIKPEIFKTSSSKNIES
jgi:phage shock protein PspC (stress-responsive transcriptional regulator)